jgi:ribosomal protein S12 methylthiotransferase
MDQPAVSIISLGCAKNLVDTERMLAALVDKGWLIAQRPQDADALLINTCGFIGAARDEAYQIIEEALELKAAGVVQAVILIGCLVQLMPQQLAERYPNVDAWVGVVTPEALADACQAVLAPHDGTGACAAQSCATQTEARPVDSGPRLRITPRHFAYLRIGEGCDNRCHYCLIPTIRGPLRSKPMEMVIGEANDLIADGARELIVIGQDTTNYGVDLYSEQRLAQLLRQLRELDGLEWLRLLYTHPAHFGEDLIDVLAEGRPVLPYVDIPIQHASDSILAAMGRGIDQAGTRDLIARIRTRVPDAIVRTSLIVGFPGETDEDFAELVSFVRETRFDRLGAFAYSREEGTHAAELDGQVPDELKEERLDAVMDVQQEIAEEKNEGLIGSEIDVVVDGKGMDAEWAGRTVNDAPDVDGTIKFEDVKLEPGQFGRARITDAYGYDLTGRMI